MPSDSPHPPSSDGTADGKRVPAADVHPTSPPQSPQDALLGVPCGVVTDEVPPDDQPEDTRQPHTPHTPPGAQPQPPPPAPPPPHAPPAPEGLDQPQPPQQQQHSQPPLSQSGSASHHSNSFHTARPAPGDHFSVGGGSSPDGSPLLTQQASGGVAASLRYPLGLSLEEGRPLLTDSLQQRLAGLMGAVSAMRQSREQARVRSRKMCRSQAELSEMLVRMGLGAELQESRNAASRVAVRSDLHAALETQTHLYLTLGANDIKARDPSWVAYLDRSTQAVYYHNPDTGGAGGVLQGGTPPAACCSMYWDEEDVSSLLLDIPHAKAEVKKLDESVKHLNVAVAELEHRKTEGSRVFVGPPGGIMFKQDRETVLADARARLAKEKKAAAEARARLDTLLQRQVSKNRQG